MTESATGLWFVAMNYTVHGIMYSYYCLMALKIGVVQKYFPAPLLTVMQTSQMAVGVFVVAMSWCVRHPHPRAEPLTHPSTHSPRPLPHTPHPPQSDATPDKGT